MSKVWATLLSGRSFSLSPPTPLQQSSLVSRLSTLLAFTNFKIVFAAFVSDRWKIRGPVILGFLPLSIIGYAIIRSTKNLHVKYGALFLMASGLYPSGKPHCHAHLA